MASLSVNAPDGATLDVNIPEGTPESAYGQLAQEALDHYTSLPGALESAGHAAINNLPLGGQIGALGTAALKGTDYSQGMKEFNQKAAEAKSEHPVAYGAGAVAGSLAPLAIPGVGEALKAAPVATSAALGAANDVGNTDIIKEPNEALKQGLEGAAIGGILGHLMPKSENMQERLESYANKKTVQDLGMAPGNLGVPGEEIQNIGTMAHELGADAGDLESRFNTIHDAWQQTGKQLEELGQGQVLHDPSEIQQTLMAHIQESANTLGFEGNPEIKMYQKALDRIHPGMPFEQLQEIKSNYANRAFDKFGNIKPNGEVPFNIYKAASDAMDSLESAHPEYPELKKYYSVLSDMKQGVEGQLQREQATGIQAKGFGLAGKMGGMVLGGNVPATAAASATLGAAHPFLGLGLATTIVNNPGAMAAGARNLAEKVPAIAAGANLSSIDAMVSNFIKNPKTYGKFSAPLMQSLQTGGKQGFAATSFVLRQQHPELNEMMMHSAEHGTHEAIQGALEGQNEQ